MLIILFLTQRYFSDKHFPTDTIYPTIRFIYDALFFTPICKLKGIKHYLCSALSGIPVYMKGTLKSTNFYNINIIHLKSSNII